MVMSGARKRPSELQSRYETELEMTQLAAQGDQAAKRDLVNLVIDQVRRTISYLARPNREAEDLSQLALIQILRSAGSFRGECTLKYWADRIAVRTAMKQFRKRQRRERLGAASWEPPPAVSDQEVDVDVDAIKVRARLGDLLDKLSEERRTAVVLHHVQGYVIAEIAAMTGAPVNTVRDRLRVGRKQLRKRILADPCLKDWVGSGAI
jgi:RNA polymerase sigma-70 factor (ECF subfamily)